MQDEKGKPALSKQEVLDNVKVMIFAGHDTTSNTLAWALFFIAADQAVQARLNLCYMPGGRIIGKNWQPNHLYLAVPHSSTLFLRRLRICASPRRLQERLVSELSTCPSDNFDELDKLPYLAAVVNEVRQCFVGEWLDCSDGERSTAC